MSGTFREVFLLVCLVQLSILTAFPEPFSWVDQEWESEQEQDFWLALPDWGERELDFHKFRYDVGGSRVEETDDSLFSGYAKGYFSKQGAGIFRFVARVENGWVVMIKILSPGGKNHNLRSYQKGALLGRYIDWHPNGERLRDGDSGRDGKAGLWTEWHSNGQKKRRGFGKMGNRWEFSKNGMKMGKKRPSRFLKRVDFLLALPGSPMVRSAKNLGSHRKPELCSVTT